jgi:hypothetical protein
MAGWEATCRRMIWCYGRCLWVRPTLKVGAGVDQHNFAVVVIVRANAPGDRQPLRPHRLMGGQLHLGLAEGVLGNQASQARIGTVQMFV